MSLDTDKRRLSQVQTLQHIQRDMKRDEMITVYQTYTEENSTHYIYCALIPSAQIEKALSDSTWDMEFSQCMPSGMISSKGSREVREYLRYGVDNGIEPLIIDRNFYRLRDDYREISEEFRLFHNLHHDRKTNQYIKIDEDGNEEIVAVVEPNRVQIRLKEIRQFLAVKEMHLAIQFIFSETSTQPLEALGFTSGDEDRQGNLMRWMQRYGDLDGVNNCRAFSRFVGKRLVEPLSKAKSGFWPFAEVSEQLETQFTNSDRLEHIFKQRYHDLQKVSQTYLGWQWLLPLHTVDAHHLKSLRIPATDEQRDFDAIVLSLTKILIDSLNEKSLKKLIPFEKQEAVKDKRGIALLDAALRLNNLEGADAHIDFLRKLQDLRSSGSAHRKGRTYLKKAAYFDIENQSLRHVFADIVSSASDTLGYFIVLVNSGRIREILERNQVKAGYAILNEMIGMAESERTDGSVNHDEVIYELQSKP